MKAIISLFVWLKLLYFLRIFEETGYLIRIIIQVCADMRFFLLVLLLTIIAFGEAVKSFSDANYYRDVFNACNKITDPVAYKTCAEDYDPNGFAGYLGGIGYVYRMCLGDFGTDAEAFGTIAVPFMWALFILCSVLNMIIMLNLLIAIISESFTKINSVSKQANVRERANIIYENLHFVPENERNSYCH